MGLGNYLIEMADAATQTALYLERRGEFNLARFYRNASEGFKERLGDLTLEEVWNQA